MSAIVLRDSALNSRPMPADKALIRRGDHGALPDYIQRDEVYAMAAAAENARDRMLVLALWATGGRVSEVLALRRCDLDVAGRTVRLTNLKQRRTAEKTIYLSPAFALELLAYCEAQGIRGNAFLFTAKRSGRPISRQTAWRIVHRLGRWAGVARDGDRAAWPHLIRHGHAVHLVTNGVPLPAVKDQLGHASILTTLVYTKISSEDKRRIIGGVNF